MIKRDPVTGLTDAEMAKLAEQTYEQRDDTEAWQDEAQPEISPDVRSVVSVRFSRGELAPIEKAAAAAGVPVSTYIRNAAINAGSTIDLDEARRSAQAIQRDLTTLMNKLGANDAERARSSRRSPESRAVA